MEDIPAGVVLFNLLEEIMVRNTRPTSVRPIPTPRSRASRSLSRIGGCTPSSTTWGRPTAGCTTRSWPRSTRCPWHRTSWKRTRKSRPSATKNSTSSRKAGKKALVGIFKTRFLKRLESSIEAFRLSLRRALTFEETYKDYLLDGKVVSSKDFQKAIRFLARDEEDDIAAGSVADELDAVAEAREYIESLPTVDLNQYELRKLTHDVEADVELLQELYDRTEALAANDGKLERLKELLAGDLKGKKVLIFSTFKDTTRYLHQRAHRQAVPSSLNAAGNPHIRRIDSGNHPDERGHIIGQFAPVASGNDQPTRAADRHSHQHGRSLGRPEPSGLRPASSTTT